jgi:sugar-specific transcriptional regulator TrmB
MVRSRFVPDDPEAVHDRFERVKARALKRLEEEARQLKRVKAEPPEPKRALGRPGARRPAESA